MAFLALMGVLSVITMRGEMSETTAMSVIVALGLTDGEQKLIETAEQVVMEAVRVMAPCIERKLAGMGVVGDEAARIQQRLGEAAADAAKAKVVFRAATAPLTQQEQLFWKDRAATRMSDARLERVLVALGVPNAKMEQQLAGRDCASEPPAAAAAGAAGEAEAPPAWFRHERQLRSSLAGEDDEFKEAATAAAAAAAEAGADSAEAPPAWFRHERHLRSSLAGEDEEFKEVCTEAAAAAAAAATEAGAGSAEAPPAWFRHEHQLRSSLAGEDEEFKEAATAAAAAAAEAGAGSAASPAWFRHERHLRNSLAEEEEQDETEEGAAAAAAAAVAAATAGAGADLPPPGAAPRPSRTPLPPALTGTRRALSGTSVRILV